MSRRVSLSDEITEQIVEMHLTPWNQNIILYTVNVKYLMYGMCIKLLNICIHVIIFLNIQVRESLRVDYTENKPQQN